MPGQKKRRFFMKISMWMLANRLASLEPELHIRDGAEQILKSARMAYSTDCVVVSQEGADVRIAGGGDWILIHDMPVNEIFEVVQGVFDLYDDWFSRITELADRHDYQGIVDAGRTIFQNPLVIVNGNYRVLGISREYGPDELDTEWKYMKEYGYNSVEAVRTLNGRVTGEALMRDGILSFADTPATENGGISYGMYVNHSFCGRVSVLEKDRQINTGDRQVLRIMGGVIRYPLSLEQSGRDGTHPNVSVISSLLSGETVSEPVLKRQMRCFRWKDGDRFIVYVFRFLDRYRSRQNEMVFARTLQNQIAFSTSVVWNSDILLIYDLTEAKGEPSMELLMMLADRNRMQIGASNTLNSLYSLRDMYRQASAALAYGRLLHPDQNFYRFYDYAIDYILESGSLSESLPAVHPDVAELWKNKIDCQDPLYDTLRAYLVSGLSQSRAARRLYVHRNTMTYRLHKLENDLHCDMRDVYTGEYMMLSIRVLELFQKKFEEESGKELEDSSSVFPYLYTHESQTEEEEAGDSRNDGYGAADRRDEN